MVLQYPGQGHQIPTTQSAPHPPQLRTPPTVLSSRIPAFLCLQKANPRQVPPPPGSLPCSPGRQALGVPLPGDPEPSTAPPRHDQSSKDEEGGFRGLWPSPHCLPPAPPHCGDGGPGGAAHVVGELEAAHVGDVLSECVLPVHLARREEARSVPRPSGLLQAWPPWPGPGPRPSFPFPGGWGSAPPCFGPHTQVSPCELIHAPEGTARRPRRVGRARGWFQAQGCARGCARSSSAPARPGDNGGWCSEGVSPAGCRR